MQHDQKLSGQYYIMDKVERDKIILEKLERGDEDALKSLFDAYYSLLCVYSVQITESLDESEDIVQELFINFWEKKRHNNISISLNKYLFYAVRNASIMYARKNNKYLKIQELEEEAYSPIDDLQDDEELMLRYQQLHKTLEKLSPKEYKVLTEVILNGKKYKEVALELNISVNTVKTHLARALKILRKDKSLTFFFSLFF